MNLHLTHSYFDSKWPRILPLLIQKTGLCKVIGKAFIGSLYLLFATYLVRDLIPRVRMRSLSSGGLVSP